MNARLNVWEKAGLALIALAVTAFGGLVVLRSAFQKDRKTDFGVYARAGYAVRQTIAARIWPEWAAEEDRHRDATMYRDVYSIVDNRGWHYCYPPPFAVMMVPLADQFPWEEKPNYLPFWLSVSIWYLINVGLTVYALNAFAAAALPDAERWSRRWWYARLVPFYICLGGIGYTLSRGQVNIVVIALIAAMFRATIEGRNFRSGFWLASAISLKVIPAYLLLFPIFLRDAWQAKARTALGLFAGIFIWLGLVPIAAWGFRGGIEADMKVFGAVLAPGATGTGDPTREKELTGAKSTDSQSFQAVIHNLRYPDRAKRPDTVDIATRLSHWAICGFMTLATLVVGLLKVGRNPADRLIFLGCLCVVMMLTTPVSHMHYYSMVLPLVAGLWLQNLSKVDSVEKVSPSVVIALLLWGSLTALPLFPPVIELGLLEAGLATFATTGLWIYGIMAMARSEPLEESLSVRAARSEATVPQFGLAEDVGR